MFFQMRRFTLTKQYTRIVHFFYTAYYCILTSIVTISTDFLDLNIKVVVGKQLKYKATETAYRKSP